MTEGNAKIIIENAKLGLKIMSITYRKQLDNKVVRRQIEPYEVSGGYLWGYDVTASLPRRKQSIKKWIIQRIINLQIEQKTFKPRKFIERR